MLTISALRIAAAKQDLLTVDTDACVPLDIQEYRRLYTSYFYYVLNRVFHGEIKLTSMNFGPHNEKWRKSPGIFL